MVSCLWIFTDVNLSRQTDVCVCVFVSCVAHVNCSDNVAPTWDRNTTMCACACLRARAC